MKETCAARQGSEGAKAKASRIVPGTSPVTDGNSGNRGLEFEANLRDIPTLLPTFLPIHEPKGTLANAGAMISCPLVRPKNPLAMHSEGAAQ